MKFFWLAEYLFAPRASGVEEATPQAAVAVETIAPCTPPLWSSPSSAPELHSAFASPAAAALCFSGPCGPESPQPGPAQCPPLDKGLSSGYWLLPKLSSASFIIGRGGMSAAAACAAQQQSALERSRPSIPNLESVCSEERNTLCLEWLTRPNRGWNDTITWEDYAKFQSRSRPNVPVLPMPDTRLVLGESLEMVPSYGERPNSSRGTCTSSNAECGTSSTTSGTSTGCGTSTTTSCIDSSDGAACTVNQSIVICPGSCGFPAGWGCHCDCDFTPETADEPLASPSSHDLPAPWDIPTAPVAGGPVLFFGQCAPPAMEPELERGLELTASSSSSCFSSCSSSCCSSAAWCDLEPRQQPAPEVTEGEIVSTTSSSEQPCDCVCEAQQQPQPQRQARAGSQVPGYLRQTASSSAKAGERRRQQGRRA